MREVFLKLYNHPSGKERIISMLNNKNKWVQSWVAAQVLSESKNNEAVSVLENLLKKDGLVSLIAEMTLKEFKNGTLDSPFGIQP
jgi:hypothetical protein